MTAAAWRAAHGVAAWAALVVAGPPFALACAWRPALRRGWRERLGAAPRVPGRPAWIQAASVGELRVADAIARGLHAAAPQVPIVLSSTTPAGLAAARASEDVLAHPAFAFPLDAPPMPGTALDRLAPRAFIAVETEIWPTLLAGCRVRDVPAALVNGRISDRSFPRYRRTRPLIADALGTLEIVAARTQLDAERLVALGAHAGRVTVTGDVKFDAAVAAEGEPDLPWARGAGLQEPPWIVFASTAAGEEGAVLDALERVRAETKDVRAVIAPRRAERWDEVADLVRQRRLPLVRRSEMGASTAVPRGGVLLLDTLGELARTYRHAEAVFVGGSLVPRGGHNLLEPAGAGRPVLFGPHVQNFRDAEAALLREGGGLRVTVETLHRELSDLLADEARRRRVGAAARRAVAANLGATARTVELLLPLLDGRRRDRRSA